MDINVMTAYVPMIDKYIVGFDTDSSAFEFLCGV